MALLRALVRAHKGAGLWHIGKLAYFTHIYLNALLQNAQGKDSGLTTQEAIQGLTMIGMCVVIGHGLSKLSLRLAGSLAVGLMVKDFVDIAQHMMYGPSRALQQQKILAFAQRKMHNMEASLNRTEQLHMINQLRQWMVPQLIKQRLYMELPHGQYMPLTSARYSEAQHHYQNAAGQVISLPPMLHHGKEVAFTSVCFQGVSYQRRYVGPEGRLYTQYADQLAAWASYKEEGAFVDLIPTAKAKHMPQREEMFQLSIHSTGEVELRSSGGYSQTGRLIEKEWKLFVTSERSPDPATLVDLTCLQQYARAYTPQVTAKVIRTKEAALATIYASRQTRSLLPEIKQVSSLLHQAYYADDAFHRFIQSTKPEEANKMVAIIDQLAQKLPGIIEQDASLTSSQKRNVEQLHQKLQKEDRFYDQFTYQSVSTLNQKTREALIPISPLLSHSLR